MSACYYSTQSYDGSSWSDTSGGWKTRTCDGLVTLTVGPSGNCRDQGTNTCFMYAYSRDNAGNIAEVDSRYFSISVPCTTPTGVSCTYNAMSNTISLDWNAVDGATEYLMEWARADLNYGDTTDTSGDTTCLVPADGCTISSTSGRTGGLVTKNNYKLHVRVETDGSTCSTPGQWSGDVICYTGTPIFPTCNKATPTQTTDSWSVTNDCWNYFRICDESPQPSGCSLDCDFGSGNLNEPYTNNIVTIPKGNWKLTATMSNIQSYAQCHGVWFCWIDDCSSKVLDVTLALELDGTSIGSASTTATAWALGDDTEVASGTGNDITIEKEITCDKASGCSLDVRRYFDYQGMAHKALIGGGGDYYYGNVKADVSVMWEESGCIAECANAKDIGAGSISTGGYESSWTCDMGITNNKRCGMRQSSMRTWYKKIFQLPRMATYILNAAQKTPKSI